MANIVLQGQSQLELNGTFMITATRFEVSGDQPVNIKYGAQGPIGASRGFERATFNVEFAVPISGLEADVLGVLNDPKGFTVTFPIGAERHMLRGAHRSRRNFSNQPSDGNSDFRFEGVAAEWVRIS